MLTEAPPAPGARANAWQLDAVLPGFEARTLEFPPEADGPVAATLVRRRAAGSSRAVLYIHGFCDYFFQQHMADAFVARGWNFYALDLRRHGRSLRPGQRPNCVCDLAEYFPEITAAIDIIRGPDGNRELLLNGHSTGGLIASLYAASGPRAAQIGALFLNSPFFDWYVAPADRVGLRLFGALGRWLPFAALRGAGSPCYGQSIHADHRGEWSFDIAWKPLAGFPIYFGWIRAITRGQRRVHRGLGLRIPVLLMHASRSHRGKVWDDAFSRSDAVLDVAHMKRHGPDLGERVRLVEIDGGLHDLVLSPAAVRERVFAELFAWLDAALPARAAS